MNKTISCKNNFGNSVDVDVNKFNFRPSVYGFILNSKNEILVCNNKSNNKMWFPGGGVELGETLEEALKREIFEETKIENIEIKEFLFFKDNFFYYQPLDEGYQAYLFFFLCKTDNIDLISNEEINDGEAKDLEWMRLEDIKKEEIQDLQDIVYENLQKILKK